MRKSSRRLVLVSAVLGALSVTLEHAAAFDLTGAWATAADQCDKVFVRKGRAKQVTFSNFSGVYGQGFIAEPNRFRGKFTNCSIKSRKDDGPSINIVVSCASGVTLSDVQFFLKVVDANSMTRLFPGIEGMDVTYHRCQI
jgi:hypothetical protein